MLLLPSAAGQFAASERTRSTHPCDDSSAGAWLRCKVPASFSERRRPLIQRCSRLQRAEPNSGARRPITMGIWTGAGGCVAVLALVSGCGSVTSSPGPASPPVAVTATTVSGLVVGEPGCPGPERLGTPCPPIPMRGAIVEIDADGKQVTATATTTTGAFALRVPPGSYTIKATSAGALHTATSQPLTVGFAPVTVTLTVDTGMR